MILDDIVEKRRVQLAREKAARPLEQIVKAAGAAPAPNDFRAALSKERLAVIAEVKKASPSKGIIQPDFHPAGIALAYQAAGADALSVLTEEHYFQGAGDYLRAVRAAVRLPILRKDFIIDPYQIYEARAIGADAILLIAALLSACELKEYRHIAALLGLQCLIEAHNEPELDRALEAGGELIGINNRDLRTFRVDLDTTLRLAEKVPRGCVLVSESGITENGQMRALCAAGVSAVLIGETLMCSGNITETLRELRDGV